MSAAPRNDREWFEEFYFTRIEHAVEDIDIYGDASTYLKGLSDFPEWVGDLVCVHWLLSEFENGGLVQFFINSTGILAPEAVAALRRMRLPEAGQALSRAVEFFGVPYPRDKQDRYQVLRRKAGLQLGDMEIMMWRAKLLKTMEDELDAVKPETFYARMNEYAAQNAEGPPA
jgi:hypothetical protein